MHAAEKIEIEREERERKESEKMIEEESELINDEAAHRAGSGMM